MIDARRKRIVKAKGRTLTSTNEASEINKLGEHEVGSADDRSAREKG